MRSIENPWNLTEFQMKIFKEKYCFENETFDEFFKRISNGNKDIEKLIREKKFLFGGRILANRGLHKRGKKVTYSNCYVIPQPEDSVESIYEAAYRLARTFSYGGGSGIDISKLRPNGSIVNNAAKTTTGAVSFMDLFNMTTDIIGQKGRRGALMISMSVDHPDIEEFIDIKTKEGKITKANISVRVTDKFMSAVFNDELFDCTFIVESTGEIITKTVNAKKLFRKLCENNHEWAEPGILFWDTIEQNNIMSSDESFVLGGVNPCLTGDTLIQTIEGNIPIQNLVGTQPYVYCMDNNNQLSIRQAVNVWKTRENAKIIRVNHMRGYIDCTPDHKIFTLNRGWVEAKDLLPGDKLKGLNRSKKSEKHCKVKLSGDDKYIPEHRFVAGFFYDITNKDVHHLNDNGFDNRLSNLQVLSHNEHSRITNTNRHIEVERDELGRYVEKQNKKLKRNSEVLHENPDYRSWTVINIEELNYATDVYDMCVPEVHNFVANNIVVHNCAEQPLPAGGSCLLGSLNLSEFVKNPFTEQATFDMKEFKKAVEISVNALNEVLDEGLELHPLDIQKESVEKYRQIGLGLMGLADMFIKMNMKYGSKDTFKLCDSIGINMINSALKASALLAKEKGTFSAYNKELVEDSHFLYRNMKKETHELIKKYGLRNSQLLTIAPTGSISTMLGVSGGIEPIFSISYIRKTESLGDGDQYHEIFTGIAKEYMDLKDIDKKEDLPDFFVVSQEIDPKDRISTQAILQSHIDAAISSTINLPYETTVEDVEDIYMNAWLLGLKGLTIYRDGCSRGGVLITEKTTIDNKPKELEIQKEEQEEESGCST